jgi:hypothetical protein
MRARHLVPVGLLALAAGPLAVVPAATAAGDGYHGHVACSTRKSAKPKHECTLSQDKAAFFVSRMHDATYKVCVSYPEGQRLCASDQPAPRGKLQLVTIATADVGRHTVSWFVEGKKVEGWTFEVTAG